VGRGAVLEKKHMGDWQIGRKGTRLLINVMRYIRFDSAAQNSTTSRRETDTDGTCTCYAAFTLLATLFSSDSVQIRFDYTGITVSVFHLTLL